MSNPFSNSFFTLGLLIGIASTYLLTRNTSINNNESIRQVSHDKPFLLGVTLKFKSIQDKEYFKEIFKPMAEYVRKNEPLTLSYILYESDKEPYTGVYILERYVDKEEAYLKIHKQSETFLSFRSKLQNMVAEGKVTIEGESYIESDIGYFH